MVDELVQITGEEDLFKSLDEGLSISKEIESYEKGGHFGKEESFLKIAQYAQAWHRHLTGSDLSIPIEDKDAVIELAKGYVGITSSLKAYKGLESLLGPMIEKDPAGIVYGMILPKLESLAEKIGIGGFDDSMYKETSGLINKIMNTKLEPEKAYELAKETILKDIDDLIASKPEDEAKELLEEREKLADVTAKFWAKTKSTQNGVLFFTSVVYNDKIKPYATKENREKAKNYAKNVAEAATTTDFAESYEGFQAISQFGAGLLQSKSTYAQNVAPQLGGMGAYLMNGKPETD